MTFAETHDNKDCFVCGTAISRSAIKCKQCGAYQNRYRNALVQVGAYTGALTLIASAVTYVVTTLSANLRDRDPIKVTSFSYVQGGMFLNISDKPAYLEELLILGNDRRNLYTQQIGKLAKPQEFVTYRSPPSLEPELPNRQPDEVWQRAWAGTDKCFQVDFRYPFKNGRLASVSLFFVRANDGYRQEKRFDVEAVLVPKAGAECKFPPGIYK